MIRRTVAWTACSLILTCSQAMADESALFGEDFETGLGDRWVERGFPSIERRNRFSIAADDHGNHYLEVQSDRSTSAKGVWLGFDPDDCPTMSWRWRVSNVIENASLRRKDGDDSAARLYVLLDGPSRWNPLDKRLLVYVWDNELPVGTVLPNAWELEKARMVVQESGVGRVGRWVRERVDLSRDYRRAFPGEDPQAVEALAFMADTDNTSSLVTAGFDDLVVRCGANPLD